MFTQVHILTFLSRTKPRIQSKGALCDKTVPGSAKRTRTQTDRQNTKKILWEGRKCHRKQYQPKSKVILFLKKQLWQQLE